MTTTRPEGTMTQVYKARRSAIKWMERETDWANRADLDLKVVEVEGGWVVVATERHTAEERRAWWDAQQAEMIRRAQSQEA